jgi:CRISP-associated protein Cas1
MAFADAKRLTTQDAKEMLAAAIRKAEELGVAATVAIVDSAVLTAINTGMVTAKDFLRSKAGCVLKDTGRKAFIRAYEARLDQLVTHPIFGYRCSWRSIIRLQAKLLSRWLRGDIPAYVGMTSR